MSLRHALLGALAEQPRSGYELLKHFEQSLAYAWPASHSQIYPELGRLLSENLIEQAAAGARGSKTYALTDTGLAEVRRWLRETEPDRRVRNDALLRMFFLWLLDPTRRGAISSASARTGRGSWTSFARSTPSRRVGRGRDVRSSSRWMEASAWSSRGSNGSSGRSIRISDLA